MIKVGINGFGRIGRALFRINLLHQDYEIVAINEIDPDIDNMAYLLKYDSTYGKLFNNKISREGDYLVVDDKKIIIYHEKSIKDVDWKMHSVDVVIDSSGVFENVLDAKFLIEHKIVKKVIVTHSPKSGVDLTLMIGVNDKSYIKESHHIISSSICDANAVTPFFHLINTKFGIDVGEVTTLHPWLSYQNVLDGNLRSVSSPGHFWNDYALGRNSTVSLIPKDTSLVSAMQMVIPGVESIINAMSFRTPTAIVSAADGAFYLKEKTSIEEVIKCIEAYEKEYPGVLLLDSKSLVSIDYMSSEYAAILDGRWLKVLNGKMLKFVLWYDNEWGYAKRTYNIIKFSLK
jgi:glyceraldehyde 3-phosphate dehydrogenase